MKTDIPGKTQWRLIPWDALHDVVLAFMFGNTKENRKPDDWKIVENKRDVFSDAALRHFTSWLSGERNDPESGLSHLAHAACNILILLWSEKHDR